MRRFPPALPASRSETKSWWMTSSDVFTNSTRSENPGVANNARRRPIPMEEASMVDDEGCLDSGGAEEAPTARRRPPRRRQPSAASPAIGGGSGRGRMAQAGYILPIAGHSVVGNGVQMRISRRTAQFRHELAEILPSGDGGRNASKLLGLRPCRLKSLPGHCFGATGKNKYFVRYKTRELTRQ